MPKDDGYYSQFIPQTAFRSSKHDKATTVHKIDLSLTNLNLTDPELKAALKERILKADNQIAEMLLPQDKIEDKKKDERLNYVFSQLGL
jgi:hypothetical protein